MFRLFSRMQSGRRIHIRLVNFAIDCLVHWIAYRVALWAACEHLCDELSALVRRSWVCLRFCIWFHSPIAVHYCGLQMYYLFISLRNIATSSQGRADSNFHIYSQFRLFFFFYRLGIYMHGNCMPCYLSHIKMHNEISDTTKRHTNRNSVKEEAHSR